MSRLSIGALIAAGLATVLLEACVFDRAGVSVTAPPDGVLGDLTEAERDRALPTLEASPDRVPDRAADRPQAELSVDRALDRPTIPEIQTADQAGDTTGTVKPVTQAGLGAAFSAAQVPCVDRNGVSQGSLMPIVDSGTVKFVNGTVTLAKAPGATKSWVGGLPSVTVIWDINACDLEYPTRPSEDWTSAGLLIRGATIDGQGAMQLATDTDINDINFVNVEPGGEFQGPTDFAQPTDSALTSYPQLVNSVTTAKGIILALGRP